MNYESAKIRERYESLRHAAAASAPTVEQITPDVLILRNYSSDDIIAAAAAAVRAYYPMVVRAAAEQGRRYPDLPCYYTAPYVGPVHPDAVQAVKDAVAAAWERYHAPIRAEWESYRRAVAQGVAQEPG